MADFGIKLKTRGDKNFGIKVAKSGKSITSQNLYDYNLWSKNPVGKIAEEGGAETNDEVFIDFSANADNNSIWIPYLSDDNTDWYLAGLGSPFGWGFSQIDVTNFSIQFQGGSFPAYYKYFVLVDSFKDAQTDTTDVFTSPDRELSYSSKWKSLKIFKEDSGTADGAGAATVSHGFDTQPAFLVYDNDTWKGSGAYKLNHASYVNASNLEVVGAGASGSYAYKIFANPIKGTTALSPSSNNFGIKVAANTKDVNTATFEDLAFLSGTGTFQIWQIVTVSVQTDTDDAWVEAEVSHDLGFVPAYAGLIKLTTQQLEESFFVGDIEATISGQGKQINAQVAADSEKFYFRIFPVSAPETPAGAAGTVYLFVYEKLI